MNIGTKDDLIKNDAEYKEIYGDLDYRVTLLLHGLESDWIEEEMSDDDDFRKDELKINNSIGA